MAKHKEYRIDRVRREVIQKKLLLALQDDNVVATLLTKRDLERLIILIAGRLAMIENLPDLYAEDKSHLESLLDGFKQLREVAFQ